MVKIDVLINNIVKEIKRVHFSLFDRYGMQEKGDEASWNVMLNRFMNEQNAQEKRKLLSGLGK